ncbi:4-hydroxy-tetrahydrodipicolinate synthase (EC [Olavius algarvensis Delta 1 endosymbiont]|nr:4-hydroxy-tetrahydrodipicolinate synthase (EC [Olavius algarvensis Delta 1 endosymbiont]
MNSGCYTAIATPFKDGAVDYENLAKLVDFQIQHGITGIIAVGTTGESPVLNWDEHNKVTEVVASNTKGKCLCIAGTGSNNTAESMEGTEHAVKAGADGVLLVDPYYNGPSSIEIRREYVAPIAAAFPDLDIIPYVIPGRTGAQLLPEDLALLYKSHPNVSTVKEATADMANMRRTRECCGPDYMILSGDDGMTYQMMTDPQIKAAGVISVVSNVAPRALCEMVQFLNQGQFSEAEALMHKVEPLFGLVTVKTTEKTPYGQVECRARNPLGLKTLMSILGMPSGNCRQPLGKMTPNGIEKVIEITRSVYENAPEVLQPLADYFNIDIAERLENPACRQGLFYESY